MTEAIYILFGAAALFALVLCTIKYMHFFQLNSYKFAEHKSWLLRRRGPLMLTAIIAALTALGVVFGELFGGIIAILMSLIYAAVSKPKPKKLSKKPLVFTAREKRRVCEYIYSGGAVFDLPLLESRGKSYKLSDRKGYLQLLHKRRKEASCVTP